MRCTGERPPQRKMISPPNWRPETLRYVQELSTDLRFVVGARSNVLGTILSERDFLPIIVLGLRQKATLQPPASTPITHKKRREKKTGGWKQNTPRATEQYQLSAQTRALWQIDLFFAAYTVKYIYRVRTVFRKIISTGGWG